MAMVSICMLATSSRSAGRALAMLAGAAGPPAAPCSLLACTAPSSLPAPCSLGAPRVRVATNVVEGVVVSISIGMGMGAATAWLVARPPPSTPPTRYSNEARLPRPCLGAETPRLPAASA